MSTFKTRARAVDMLGRQQIAGVPNAISELFKNAHDAYADQVIVDYFRSDRLFVLRDDGLGMTREDFEERWLTIGTESKVPSLKGISKPPEDPSKRPRPITGEKGIGRLAIAVIGPQVLVLTRAKRNNKLDNLVAAFLDWDLFEIPGINLDQIEIPLRSFPGGTLPTNEEVQQMIEVVYKNILTLQHGGYLEAEFADYIIQRLHRFSLDLADMPNFLGAPSLLDSGHGTHFYIFPAREELTEDLERLEETDSESRIRKLLLGFSNTMVPFHELPQVSAAFRYWHTDDTQPSDLIAEGEFFTPEEFESADHNIQGEFDAFGQFIGNISVYGNQTKNHVVPWKRGQNKPAACGSFRFNLAYVPGQLRQSKLPPEEWTRLSKKLDAIGGLYIYKDGIRILPYGDNDVDFLNIEKRRSKGAGYYFFSYRRMFGAIELTQTANGNLAEKAGREGFQDNRAYRDFRDILENFFTQIAADFFRDGGEQADIFEQTRSELNRLKTAKQQQEKHSQTKRRQFEIELETAFEEINSGKVQEKAESIVQSLIQRVEIAARDQDTNALIEAELAANRKLSDLRDHYKFKRPDSIGLTQRLSRDWSAYVMERDLLERDLFSKVQAEIQSIVVATSNHLEFAIDKKQRIELLVQEIVTESHHSLQTEIQAAQNTFSTLLHQFNDFARQINVTLGNTAITVEKELGEFDIVNRTSEEIEAYRRKWETHVSQEVEQYREVVKYVQVQLESIHWRRDENGYLIGNMEVVAALEEELLTLRERANADVELAQLGMALNIINHEFSHTIQAIRAGLLRLKTWAIDNRSLIPIYEDINNNFAHLDGYLTMFTPLNRRLYRTAIEIKGSSIATYIEDLFKEKFERHQVKLLVSTPFRKMVLTGYPSSFYPVFVNLVDNAVFWLKEQPLPREIKLDSNDGKFIISDNGPGIPKRDQTAIFELGFTRKPGGRGMGLYISREVLKKEGFQLDLATDTSLKGATFVISPIKSST